MMLFSFLSQCLLRNERVIRKLHMLGPVTSNYIIRKIKYSRNVSVCLISSFHSSAALSKAFPERENELAHSIMENLTAYKDTIINSPCAKKEKDNFSQNKEVTQFEQEGSFEETHLIFLYGTLKTTEDNHNIIEGKVTLEGEARSVNKYPLVIASRYNVPYLLYKEGTGKNVLGEVYKASDEMLAEMDKLENHPVYYERTLFEVRMLQTGEVKQAWVYFLKDFQPHLLDLEHHEVYHSKGSHGLQYVPRSGRDTTGYWAEVHTKH